MFIAQADDGWIATSPNPAFLFCHWFGPAVLVARHWSLRAAWPWSWPVTTFSIDLHDKFTHKALKKCSNYTNGWMQTCDFILFIYFTLDELFHVVYHFLSFVMEAFHAEGDDKLSNQVILWPAHVPRTWPLRAYALLRNGHLIQSNALGFRFYSWLLMLASSCTLLLLFPISLYFSTKKQNHTICSQLQLISSHFS